MGWIQTITMTLAVCTTGDTVLLDFSASWCQPCRQMDPTIHQLASMGFPVRKIDIDREPDLAAKYGVQSIPCFVMLVNGREVDRAVGATSFGRLEKMCRRAPAKTGFKPKQPMLAVGSRPTRQGVVPIPVVSSGTSFLPEARQASAAVASESPIPKMSPLPGWKLSQSTDSELIAATVRLRIKDDNGHSCGTGTIIDSREGQALILTCGHVFRDSKGQGAIAVDLFGPTPVKGLPGRLISYNLQRDVALLSITTPVPVVAARVAPRGYRLSSGDPVINVGCNNGADPTVRPSRVSSIDKFIGPPNVQVVGVPVEGRSGGGLFSADGLLLGVCNAADPADQEGLYAGLQSVYSELDRCGLAYVCEEPSTTIQSTSEIAGTTMSPKVAANTPDLEPQSSVATAGVRPGSTPTDASKLSREEMAALTEIQRRQANDAEVICIIRSRSDPTTKSEIFVLDHVSMAFLEQLPRKSSVRQQPHETSMEVPANGRIIQAESSGGALFSSGWQARQTEASNVQ